MAFSCVTPFRQQAATKRQLALAYRNARRCQGLFEASQAFLLRRTASQWLRLTPRREADTRERAAPLVILLDVLMLMCFVLEGRSGGASSNLKMLRQGRSGVRRTIHCIEVCEKHGNSLVNHCRENCLVSEQGKTFAKNRWVTSQNAVAKKLGQGRSGVRRTIHSIEVCEKHGKNLVNHCREKCLFGQQSKTFAKNRWVAAQDAVAKDHTLKQFFFCGISSNCGAAG